MFNVLDNEKNLILIYFCFNLIIKVYINKMVNFLCLILLKFKLKLKINLDNWEWKLKKNKNMLYVIF